MTDRKTPGAALEMLSGDALLRVGATIAETAALLGVTEQWIRDLARQGYGEIATRGRVPIVAALTGYIRFLKDEARRSSKSASASAVQQERAKEIALRNAKEEGRLVELPEAEAVFADILGTFRSTLAGVSAAATRDLTLRHAIDEAINRALEEARDAFEEKRDLLRAGGDVVLDDEAATA